MCGINGIFGLEQISNPEQIIKKMNSAIAHRGPDAEGIFKGENIVLGHRRLSIIDLQSASNQPFVSKDQKFALVFNGEIYNYLELKKQLEIEFQFSTQSDTEVLLNALIKWGKSAISKLQGMFAFAFWDVQKQSLLLVRDRLGIKPLYYAFENNKLIFSSELRAILKSDLVSKDISHVGLLDYLQYQTVNGQNTIINSIKMMEAGTWMEIKDNEVNTEKYWNPGNVKYSGDSLENAKEKIKEKFEQAIKRRLVADVDFGAFLSGGIDSSLVVANMAKFHSGRVKTFHISFAEKEFSEAKYAKIIADKYGTEHHNFELSPSDLLKSLPDSLGALDHPSGDGANTWLVSKITREAGVKMVLSGLGGDELFAGYPIFKQLPELQKMRWLLSFPKYLRKLAGDILKMKDQSVATAKKAEILIQDYFELPYVYPISRKLITEIDYKKYFDHGNSTHFNQVKNIVEKLVGYGNPGFNLPYLSKISVAEMGTYLQSTLLRDTDQMSMAHALEVRVPFLDHHLVEFALGLPDEYKLGKINKQLLVDSFPNFLPEDLVHRPKMGFVFPWEIWMKNELKEFCLERLQSLDNKKLFKPNAVLNYANLFYKSNRISWSRLWHLVVLSNWLDENV